jgi:hypothetical protein
VLITTARNYDLDFLINMQSRGIIMSLSRNDLVKECVEYMRKVAEVTPDCKGVILPSGARGGFIQYFQHPDTYKKYPNYRQIRRIIVDIILDPPSTASDDARGGYTLIPGGIIANNIIETIRDDYERFINAEACKIWIFETYQAIVTYIDSYVKYNYDREHFPTIPEVPTVMANSIFLKINNLLLGQPDLTANLSMPIFIKIEPTPITEETHQTSPAVALSPTQHQARALTLPSMTTPRFSNPADSDTPVKPSILSHFRSLTLARSTLNPRFSVLTELKPAEQDHGVTVTEPEAKKPISQTSAVPFPSLADQQLTPNRIEKIQGFFTSVSKNLRRNEATTTSQKEVEKELILLRQRLEKYKKENQIDEEIANQILASAKSFTS